MIRSDERQRSGAFPESPCNDICTLNDADVCTGCKRTLEEIAGWSQMSAAEQWQIVQSLPTRRVT